MFDKVRQHSLTIVFHAQRLSFLELFSSVKAIMPLAEVVVAIFAYMLYNTTDSYDKCCTTFHNLTSKVNVQLSWNGARLLFLEFTVAWILSLTSQRKLLCQASFPLCLSSSCSKSIILYVCVDIDEVNNNFLFLSGPMYCLCLVT